MAIPYRSCTLLRFRPGTTPVFFSRFFHENPLSTACCLVSSTTMSHVIADGYYTTLNWLHLKNSQNEKETLASSIGLRGRLAMF